MDALLFVVIMVAALAVAATVIGRAQRGASPDEPTPPETGGEHTDAADPRDRPAGPGAEPDAPHTSELHPRETDRPPAGGEDVAPPSGGPGNGSGDRAP